MPFWSCSWIQDRVACSLSNGTGCQDSWTECWTSPEVDPKQIADGRLNESMSRLLWIHWPRAQSILWTSNATGEDVLPALRLLFWKRISSHMSCAVSASSREVSQTPYGVSHCSRCQRVGNWIKPWISIDCNRNADTFSCLNTGSWDGRGHQRHPRRLTDMMEGLQKSQTFLELPVGLDNSPQPRSFGGDRCLILRQLNPALLACVRILRFGCLPGALDPTPTHFIVLRLGLNIEDIIC